ncbi:hypothetical protein C3E97_030650, partial [Pseudomonas sp. MWU12-2115]
LIPAGGALLGWVAGDIGMSDPLIADWVATQAPGLVLAMPLACAIFVLVESRIIQRNLRLLPRPEPVLPHAPMDEPVLAEPLAASVVRVVAAAEDIPGVREPMAAELLPPEVPLPPVDNFPVEPLPGESSRKRRWYWAGALAAVCRIWRVVSAAPMTTWEEPSPISLAGLARCSILLVTWQKPVRSRECTVRAIRCW